jgi:multidrug resistance efflux pump
MIMTLKNHDSRWWIGAAGVLAIAAIGGNWFFFAHDRGSSHPITSEDQAEIEPGAVVCFGHIDVEFGVQSLAPLQPGRVVEVRAKEHSRVKKGEVLILLDDRAARHLVQEVEADVEASSAQVQMAEKGIAQHAARMDQQKEAVAAAASKLQAARFVLERKQGLFKAQQMTKEEVEAAAEEVRGLEAASRAEQEKAHELALHDPKLDLQKARADEKAKKARLEQAKQALDECQLKAPADGEVLRILVGPGDVLGPQSHQPAVSFCPNSARFVRAEVAQEFAGRIQSGQKALIQNDTQPSEVWHGKVDRVSDWFTQRRSVLHEPLQFNDVRTLECIVQVDSGSTPLRIGQKVRVIIGHE